MKPVIVALNSNDKVVMSMDEFKSHMDAAYNQGYNDGFAYASTTITIDNATQPWWQDLTVSTQDVSGVYNSIESTCKATTDCEPKTSISNYLRNKGA